MHVKIGAWLRIPCIRMTHSFVSTEILQKGIQKAALTKWMGKSADQRSSSFFTRLYGRRRNVSREWRFQSLPIFVYLPFSMARHEEWRRKNSGPGSEKTGRNIPKVAWLRIMSGLRKFGKIKAQNYKWKFLRDGVSDDGWLGNETISDRSLWSNIRPIR